MYPPREIAHIFCRVRDDRTDRSLLGSSMGRHFSKIGRNKEKMSEKVGKKGGSPSSRLRRGQWGGGRRKGEGGGGEKRENGLSKRGSFEDNAWQR